MTTGLFTPVPARPATAPTTGLVVSVGVTTDGDNHWVNGMAWRPEACFPAHLMANCGSAVETDQGGADGDLAYYRPVGLRTMFDCFTRVNTPATEDEARARRQLTAATSYLLARELWLGEMTQDDTYDTPTGDTGVSNAYLASGDANIVAAGEFDPLEALGLLEEAAARAGLGQDVHLHVPRALMPQYGQVLVKTGQQLRTQTGALVISDAGYTGSGPAGQAETPGLVWMYATAPVQVRLSDIETYMVANIHVNTRTMVAERAAAATFDPCVHFAIGVALPGDITPAG